jgi:hypothetical protein
MAYCSNQELLSFLHREWSDFLQTPYSRDRLRRNFLEPLYHSGHIMRICCLPLSLNIHYQPEVS